MYEICFQGLRRMWARRRSSTRTSLVYFGKSMCCFSSCCLFSFFFSICPRWKTFILLFGWSNDFGHSVIHSWSTQRLNNGNINLPLNASFWAFPCYLKQDGQSVWWSLLVFLCYLKQDGQSVWWSLLVFLWFCPRQELKWSVTYVSETDFVFCVEYLSLIHIWRCRRKLTCRSRWSPYH